MYKDELRILYQNKRNHLSEKEYDKYNARILDLFSSHFIIYPETHIQIYLSSILAKEVDTWQIIKYFEKKNCQIYVPKVAGDDLLNCSLNQNTILKENRWGIYEPESCNDIDPKVLDMVILPCLICDERGFRVGYGKGYYDRFLKNCKKDTVKIVLSFFEPVFIIDDVSEQDVSVNYCITPNNIINYYKS